MFETLDLEIDKRGIAHLTLNRPSKRNAMSDQMIADLTQAAAQLGVDDAVRVVVLRGAGGHFCAGGDLGWMQEQIAADGPTRAREAGKLAMMLGALNRLPKPLIGRIEGSVFGGGVGLACVCDVAFATNTAKFGLTETRLGLLPATIGPYVIARLGEGCARRVFMSSRLFDAGEAARLGVIAEVADDLDALVAREIDSYLACAQGAVAQAKDLALHLGRAPDQAQIDASIKALVTRWESPEAGEGIAAFFDKRKPSWVKGER